MKKKLIVLSGFVMGFSPLVALAQAATTATGGAPKKCTPGASVVDLQTFFCKIGDVLGAILPILIALGVVYFVWGVVTYVISSDEEAKQAGRDRIIFGIIGLAVIIGLWGLVGLLRNTFDLTNKTNVTLPTVPVVIPGDGSGTNR